MNKERIDIKDICKLWSRYLTSRFILDSLFSLSLSSWIGIFSHWVGSGRRGQGGREATDISLFSRSK